MSDNVLNQGSAGMVKAALEMSWRYCTTDFEGNGSFFQKAQRSAMAYERVMDPRTWQTRSEIYFPFAKIAVDELLPNVMQYVFNEDDLFSLIPMDSKTSYEQSVSVQNYLHYRLMTVMNMWRRGYVTVKDAAKLGVGYGIIDVEYVTPYNWERTEISDIDQEVFNMQAGEAIYQPRFNHLPFSHVLPSPGGGSDPQDRDWVIVVRYRSESELRAMFEDEDNPVNGSLSSIVEETKTRNIDGQFQSYQNVMTTLVTDQEGHRGAQMRLDDTRKDLPVLIPVVEYYGKNHHVWLANGETVIHEQKDTAQTLRCPVIKATISPDNESWFCDGIISANEDMFNVNNILYNTVMDMVDLLSRPRFVRNVNACKSDLKMEPWGVTDAYGDASSALKMLDVGRIQPELVHMLGELRGITNLATGQSDQLNGQAGAGIMRGGAGAFESLLQTTGARDKLAANVLDMGFMKDLVEQLLLVEQLSIGVSEQPYQVAREERKPGQSFYDNATMTQKDLRRMYRVQINLRDKLRNSMAEGNLRIAQLQALNSMPHLARLTNPLAQLELLFGDRTTVQKLRSGANPAEYDDLQALFASFGKSQGQTQGKGTAGSGGAMGDTAQQNRMGGVSQ